MSDWSRHDAHENQKRRILIGLRDAYAKSPSFIFLQCVFILAAPGRPEPHWVFLERIVSVIVLTPTSGLVLVAVFLLYQNPI